MWLIVHHVMDGCYFSNLKLLHDLSIRKQSKFVATANADEISKMEYIRFENNRMDKRLHLYNSWIDIPNVLLSLMHGEWHWNRSDTRFLAWPLRKKCPECATIVRTEICRNQESTPIICPLPGRPIRFLSSYRMVMSGHAWLLMTVSENIPVKLAWCNSRWRASPTARYWWISCTNTSTRTVALLRTRDYNKISAVDQVMVKQLLGKIWSKSLHNEFAKFRLPPICRI